MRLLFAIAASLVTSAFAESPQPKAPAPAPGLPAIDPKTEPKVIPKTEPKILPGSYEAFSVLPSDYRNLIAQCMERFQARDFAGAIVAADKADALQPPSVWTLNTRAAVAIERRKFEEGETLCQAALKQDPEFFPALFNLCEIPFLQGKYSTARTMWQRLLTAYPVRNNTVVRDGTPELLTYRIFLCYLLEKDMKNAEAWLDRLPFPSDTAAYFYAHAAWEKAQGRETRWADWVKQAEFIWPAAKRSNFTDVLIQLGWLTDPSDAKDAAASPKSK